MRPIARTTCSQREVCASELLLAPGREAVIFSFRCSPTPEGGDPTPILQAVQRGIERPVFNLQRFVGAPLYGVGYGLSMGGADDEGLEDEHVQGSLDHFELQRDAGVSA